MNINKNAFSVHLALFTVTLIYAGNYSIAKWAMPEFISPFGFILLRVFFGALIFYAYYRFIAFEPIKEKRHLVQFAVAGFFGVALNMLAFFKGLSITTPINASVLMLFAPVFVVIFSRIKNKQRLKLQTIIGLIIAFTSAAFLVGIEQFSLGSAGVIGDMLIVLNALSYGFYLVYVAKLLKIYKATTITAYIFLFGLIFVLPFGYSELMAVKWSGLSNSAIWSMVYVVLAVTIIAYFFNSWGIKKSNSTLVGTYVYLQPVLASIIAILLNQDVLSLEKTIFAALIILGVYLVNSTKK